MADIWEKIKQGASNAADAVGSAVGNAASVVKDKATTAVQSNATAKANGTAKQGINSNTTWNNKTSRDTMNKAASQNLTKATSAFNKGYTDTKNSGPRTTPISWEAPRFDPVPYEELSDAGKAEATVRNSLWRIGKNASDSLEKITTANKPATKTGGFAYTSDLTTSDKPLTTRAKEKEEEEKATQERYKRVTSADPYDRSHLTYHNEAWMDLIKKPDRHYDDLEEWFSDVTPAIEWTENNLDRFISKDGYYSTYLDPSEREKGIYILGNMISDTDLILNQWDEKWKWTADGAGYYDKQAVEDYRDSLFSYYEAYVDYDKWCNQYDTIDAVARAEERSKELATVGAEVDEAKAAYDAAVANVKKIEDDSYAWGADPSYDPSYVKAQQEAQKAKEAYEAAQTSYKKMEAQHEKDLSDETEANRRRAIERKYFSYGDDRAKWEEAKAHIIEGAKSDVPDLGKGNIDLNSRPVFVNDDGTYSTVDSTTVTEDGKYVLIPTVCKVDGEWKHLSPEEAYDYYKESGEYLGKFDSEKEADAYAEELHKDQEEKYSEVYDELVYINDNLYRLDYENLSTDELNRIAQDFRNKIDLGRDGKYMGGTIDRDARLDVLEPEDAFDSYVYYEDGKFYLIPAAIEEDGEWTYVDSKTATDNFKATGEYFGYFKTKEEAEAAARAMESGPEYERRLYNHWKNEEVRISKELENKQAEYNEGMSYGRFNSFDDPEAIELATDIERLKTELDTAKEKAKATKPETDVEANYEDKARYAKVQSTLDQRESNKILYDLIGQLSVDNTGHGLETAIAGKKAELEEKKKAYEEAFEAYAEKHGGYVDVPILGGFSEADMRAEFTRENPKYRNEVEKAEQELRALKNLRGIKLPDGPYDMNPFNDKSDIERDPEYNEKVQSGLGAVDVMTNALTNMIEKQNSLQKSDVETRLFGSSHKTLDLNDGSGAAFFQEMKVALDALANIPGLTHGDQQEFADAMAKYAYDVSVILPNDTWSVDEINTYAYFLGDGNIEAALEYAHDQNAKYAGLSKAERTQMIQDFAASMADKAMNSDKVGERILANLWTAGMTVAQGLPTALGVSFVDSLATYSWMLATGEAPVTYSPTVTEMAEATTQGISLLLDQYGKLEDVLGTGVDVGWGTVYNALASSIQSLETAFVGGKLTGAVMENLAPEVMSLLGGQEATAELIQSIYTDIVFAGSAMASGAMEAYERTGDINAAMKIGLINGICEGLFETVSLEMLVNGLGEINPSAWLPKSLLIQGLTEGSEEMFTDLGNWIGDWFVNADMSEYEKLYRDLQNDYGLSKEEAEREVKHRMNAQLLEDGIVGAMSGFGSSAVHSGGERISLMKEGSKIFNSDMATSLVDAVLATQNTAETATDAQLDGDTAKSPASETNTEGPEVTTAETTTESTETKEPTPEETRAQQVQETLETDAGKQVDEILSQDEVTKDEAREIMRTPDLRSAFMAITGIKLQGSSSRQINAILHTAKEYATIIGEATKARDAKAQEQTTETTAETTETKEAPVAETPQQQKDSKTEAMYKLAKELDEELKKRNKEVAERAVRRHKEIMEIQERIKENTATQTDITKMQALTDDMNNDAVSSYGLNAKLGQLMNAFRENAPDAFNNFVMRNFKKMAENFSGDALNALAEKGAQLRRDAEEMARLRAQQEHPDAIVLTNVGTDLATIYGLKAEAANEIQGMLTAILNGNTNLSIPQIFKFANSTAMKPEENRKAVAAYLSDVLSKMGIKIPTVASAVVDGREISADQAVANVTAAIRNLPDKVQRAINFLADLPEQRETAEEHKGDYTPKTEVKSEDDLATVLSQMWAYQTLINEKERRQRVLAKRFGEENKVEEVKPAAEIGINPMAIPPKKAMPEIGDIENDLKQRQIDRMSGYGVFNLPPKNRATGEQNRTSTTGTAAQTSGNTQQGTVASGGTVSKGTTVTVQQGTTATNAASAQAGTVASGGTKATPTQATGTVESGTTGEVEQAEETPVVTVEEFQNSLPESVRQVIDKSIHIGRRIYNVFSYYQRRVKESPKTTLDTAAQEFQEIVDGATPSQAIETVAERNGTETTMEERMAYESKTPESAKPGAKTENTATDTNGEEHIHDGEDAFRHDKDSPWVTRSEYVQRETQRGVSEEEANTTFDNILRRYSDTSVFDTGGEVRYTNKGVAPTPTTPVQRADDGGNGKPSGQNKIVIPPALNDVTALEAKIKSEQISLDKLYAQLQVALDKEQTDRIGAIYDEIDALEKQIDIDTKDYKILQTRKGNTNGSVRSRTRGNNDIRSQGSTGDISSGRSGTEDQGVNGTRTEFAVSNNTTFVLENGRVIFDPTSHKRGRLTQAEKNMRAFARAMGVNRLVIVNAEALKAGDTKINGWYGNVNGERVIVWNSNSDLRDAYHEIFHAMLDAMNLGEKRAFMKGAIEHIFRNKEAYDKVLKWYSALYGKYYNVSGQTLTDLMAEEILCDIYAGIDRVGLLTKGKNSLFLNSKGGWMLPQMQRVLKDIVKTLHIEDISNGKATGGYANTITNGIMQYRLPVRKYLPQSFMQIGNAFGLRAERPKVAPTKATTGKASVVTGLLTDSIDVQNSEDGTPEIFDISANPRFEGKSSIATEYTPAEKETITVLSGKVNKKVNMENGVPKLQTVREVRDKAFRDSGFKESAIEKINNFIDSIADFVKGAEGRFEYLDFADINQATLQYDPINNTINLSSLINNGEYQLNMDFGTVCERRQALQTIVDKLLADATYDENGIASVDLNPTTLFQINEILKDEGINTQCLICFVETKRLTGQKQYGEFATMWNTAVMNKLMELGRDAEFFDFKNGESFSEEVLANRKKALEGLKMSGKGLDVPKLIGNVVDRLAKGSPEDLKLINTGDIISSKGRTNMVHNFPLLDAIIKKKGGTAAPKAVYSYIPYNGEIEGLVPQWKGITKKMSDEEKRKALQKYVKNLAGVRSQSFSDFIITHIFDHLQKTAGLSAMGLSAHTYTKVPARAELFGLTGEKINMSLLFDVDTELDPWFAGLTEEINEDDFDFSDPENRPYNFSDFAAHEKDKTKWVQSFPWKTALRLQNTEGYSKNVGTIGVALSYWHYKAMLADPEIRMIIGYHKSSLPGEFGKAANLKNVTDYTPVQNVLHFNGFSQLSERNPFGVPSYATPPSGFKQNKQAVSDNPYSDLKKVFKERLNAPENKGKSKGEVAHALMQEILDYANDNNYTFETTKAKNGHGDFKLYEDIEVTRDPKMTSDNFIAYCFENGYLPSFYEFSTDENYYKQVFDFNMYDKLTGEYAPQGAVRMLDEKGELLFPKNMEKLLEYFTNEYNNQQERTQNFINNEANMEKIRGITDRGTEGKMSISSEEEAPYDLSGVEVYPEEGTTEEIETDSGTVTTGKFSLDPDKLVSVTYFAGTGTLDYAIRDRVEHLLAVEYDPDILEMFMKNNGNSIMVTDSDVTKVEPGAVIAGHVDYFHASPVCKNFSRANNKSGETEMDISFAKSIAKAIRAWMPKAFTLENVKGYKGSKSLQIVLDTLKELGYDYDEGEVYRTSDYGGATIRDRLFVRAVLDGELPPVRDRVPQQTWWDVVEDLVPELDDATLSPHRQERLSEMSEKLGVDLYHPPQPILLLSGTKGGEIQIAYANQPAPTLMTKGEESRIILPDGTIKKVTPQIYARIQGIGDDFILPTRKRNPDIIHQTNAFKVLGNGVPTQLTHAVVDPLLDYVQESKQEGKFSIVYNVEDADGNVYDRVVKLDYPSSNKIFKDPKEFMNFLRSNMLGKEFTVYRNYRPEKVTFASPNDAKFTNTNSGNRYRPLEELRYKGTNLSRLVLLNAEDAAEVSYLAQHKNENTHGYIDTRGWDIRNFYVMDKNNTIYPAWLYIARANDGRNLIYQAYVDKNNGIAASNTPPSGNVTQQTMPLSNIPQNTEEDNSQNFVGSNERASLASDEESMGMEPMAEDNGRTGGMYSVHVTDPAELQMLNEQLENGDVVYTYKSFLRYEDEDGNVKLIAPMAGKQRDEDNKLKLSNALQPGVWEKSIGNPNSRGIVPDLNKKGSNKGKQKVDKYGRKKWKYNLEKSDVKSTVPAAFNPYQHSSDQVLNDQFSIAYKRPQMVTYLCAIPKSELTSGYWYHGTRNDGEEIWAKDPVGMHPWKTGIVAGKLKNTKRQVYLSRWLMPVRELSNSEVAQMYKDILDKESSKIAVPYNVVPPGLLTELERIGVPINYNGSEAKYKADGALARERVEQELANTTEGVFSLDSSAEAEYGLNFRDPTGELLERVFNGEKKYETRSYTNKRGNGKIPSTYLNRQMGIVQTGDGQAKLVGYWELGNGELRDSAWLNEHREELGNDGTEFEAVDGESKWVYPIKWAYRTEPQNVSSKGIRARSIEDKWLSSVDVPEDVKAVDQKYSIAGPSAESADFGSLNTAIEMELNGANQDAIWADTGWFRGADGLWRFEIFDGDIQLRTDNLDTLFQKSKQAERGEIPWGYMPVQKLLSGPNGGNALFENYPQLKNINILMRTNPNEYGHYDRSLRTNGPDPITGDTHKHTIYLSSYWLGEDFLSKSEEEKQKGYDLMLSTLLHEIQHAIQRIEGFANGADPSIWRRIQVGGYDGFTPKDRAHQSLWLMEKNIGEKEMDRFEALFNLRKEAIYSDGPDRAQKTETYEKGLSNIRKDYDAPTIASILNDFNDYINFEGESQAGVSAFDLYRRTAGEVESREVENRRTSDLSWRKENKPNTQYNSVVFTGIHPKTGRASSVGQFSLSTAVDEFGDSVDATHIDLSRATKSQYSDSVTYTNDSAIIQTEDGQTVVIENIGPDSPEARYIEQLRRQDEYSRNEPYTIPAAARNGDTGYRNGEQGVSLRRGTEEVSAEYQEEPLRRTGIIPKRNAESGSQSTEAEGVRYSISTDDIEAGGYPIETLYNSDGEVVTTSDEYPLGDIHREVIHAADKNDFDGFEDKLNAKLKRGAKIDQTAQETMARFIEDLDAVTPTIKENLKKRLNFLINKYGEKPHAKHADKHPDRVGPDATNNKTKTRKHQMTEIRNTDKEAFADLLSLQALTDATRSYVPISNKQTIAEAERIFGRHGANAPEFVMNHLADLLESGQMPSALDIALGEIAIVELSHEGRYAEASKVVADLSIIGTQLGQAVQAMNILRKLTPQGQLYYMQKVVNYLNTQYKDRIEDPNDKMDRIYIRDEFRDAILGANSKKDLEDAVEALKDDIAKQIPPTWMDKWNAWRYLAMLGNPRTHVRNIIGNAGFKPAVFLKDQMARFLENNTKWVDPSAKMRTFKADLSKDSAWMQYALNEDWEAMEKIVAGEAGGNKWTDANDIMRRRRIFNAEWLHKLEKFNGEALGKEDIFFMKSYYCKALAEALQARGITEEQITNKDETGKLTFGTDSETAKILNECRQWAANEAQRNTYHDANAAAQTLNRLKQSSPFAGFLLEGLMPFTTTPLNILKRGIEYSPIGLIQSVVQLNKDLRSNKYTTSQCLDRLAAGMSGTAITILGFFLSSLGLLRGAGPDDKEEAAFEKLQGHQNWSIEIGNVSYTIDWMAPTALPLFTGCGFFELLTKGNKSDNPMDWVMTMSKLAEPMMSLSMLDGIESTLSSLAYSTETNTISTLMLSMMTSYFAQGMPTILGQAARSLDADRRQTYNDPNKTGFDSTLNKFWQNSIQAKIPNFTKIFGYDLPVSEETKMAYVDEWGRTDSSNTFLEKFWKVFENFVSPGYGNIINETPVDAELTRLLEATGERDILPTKLGKKFTVDGEEKKLTADEYEELSKINGQTYYSILSEIFLSEEYNALDDENKLKVIETARTYSAAVARNKIAPDYDLQRWQETASKVGAVDYILMKSDIDDNKSKEKLFALMVNNPNLTPEQMAGIMGDKYSAPSEIRSVSNNAYVYQMTDADEEAIREIYQGLLDERLPALLDTDNFIASDYIEKGRLAQDLDSELMAQAKEIYADILDHTDRVMTVGRASALGKEAFEKVLDLYNGNADDQAKYISDMYKGENTIANPAHNGYNMNISKDQKRDLAEAFEPAWNKAYKELLNSNEFRTAPNRKYQEAMIADRYNQVTTEVENEFAEKWYATGNYTGETIRKASAFSWDEARQIAMDNFDNLEDQARWLVETWSSGAHIDDPTRPGYVLNLTTAQKGERNDRVTKAGTIAYVAEASKPGFENLTKEQQDERLKGAVKDAVVLINTDYAMDLLNRGTASVSLDDSMNRETFYDYLVQSGMSETDKKEAFKAKYTGGTVGNWDALDSRITAYCEYIDNNWKVNMTPAEMKKLHDAAGKASGAVARSPYGAKTIGTIPDYEYQYDRDYALSEAKKDTTAPAYTIPAASTATSTPSTPASQTTTQQFTIPRNEEYLRRYGIVPNRG